MILRGAILVVVSCVAGCGGAVCSGDSGASLCIDRSTFASGDAIAVQFASGPAQPRDWIAIYLANACNSTCPHGSTLWQYSATGSHDVPPSGVSSGRVVLDESANAGNWPLWDGDWELVYLVNDGYSPIARLSFSVKGGAPLTPHPSCSLGKPGAPCGWDDDCCSDSCDFSNNTCN